MRLLEGKQKTPEESGVFCSADRLSWRPAASASAELAIHDYFCRAKLLPPWHASPGLNVCGSARPSLFSWP